MNVKHCLKQVLQVSNCGFLFIPKIPNLYPNHLKSMYNFLENEKTNDTGPTPNQYTTFHSFIKYLYIWDIAWFVQWSLKFSDLNNLNFLPSKTWKIKLDKFLTGGILLTHINSTRPQRFKFKVYLYHETAVHILLVDTSCRWFVSVALFWWLNFLWAPFNSATSLNNLKIMLLGWDSDQSQT